MASQNSFATASESHTSLEYNCSNLNIKITVIYDIDTDERMEVDYQPEVPPQHKVQLKMSGTGFSTESCFDSSEIKDYQTGIAGFLNQFVKSRALVMKMVRFISFYLHDRGSNVIHLVPGDEEFWIRKVDEHGRMSTFDYKSDPVLDILSREEIDQINSFVGHHHTAPWLSSVLWHLAEMAVKRFGQIVTR